MVHLDVNGVMFSYGSKKVLDDVSFSITNGEIVGILGQNGSGKTTLLNCINSEYRPKHGTVVIRDFSPEALEHSESQSSSADVQNLSNSERSRIIATVEQSSFMSFPFSVMETVRMGRYSHTGMFDDDNEEEIEKIYEVMKSTGILKFADRSVNELSGGEWRRVMIAQALAQEPEILLLDEPTLHLDINHQFELMDLLRSIVSERNILIVIVTHDLPWAARYCDKIIIMKEGKIVDAGPAEDTITTANIENIFHMRAKIGYDKDIKGIGVFLIEKIDCDE